MRAQSARRLENSRSLGKEGIPDAMLSALVVSLILGAKDRKKPWDFEVSVA
jgi:hypothetical protein